MNFFAHIGCTSQKKAKNRFLQKLHSDEFKGLQSTAYRPMIDTIHAIVLNGNDDFHLKKYFQLISVGKLK